MQELMRVFVWNLLNSVHLKWWFGFCRCALVCKTTTLIISSSSRVSCRTEKARKKNHVFSPEARKMRKRSWNRDGRAQRQKQAIKKAAFLFNIFDSLCYFSVFALVALDVVCVVAFLGIRCNLKTLHTLHIVRWKCACAFCAHQLLVYPVEWMPVQVLKFHIYINHDGTKRDRERDKDRVTAMNS